MGWKNIPPFVRPNWSRMNEGQRRYAMEQYNLALVRRGLPIDHPVPEADPDPVVEESHYETADEGTDSDTIVASDNEEYESAVELEEELHNLSNEENNMPPPNRGSTIAPVAGPSGTGKGGKAIKRTNTNDSGINDDTFSLPGTGQGQGGAPGGDSGVQTVSLPQPHSRIHSQIRYYSKVHRFFSWGISYQVMETTINKTTYRNISTPFVNIPWDRHYMYLNPCEFTTLPAGSTFSKVRCEVRARNVRVAFPTNSSGTELATLNQNKDICYAVGLNKSIPCINVTYTKFQDTEPMIPADYLIEKDADHTELVYDLYGRSWATTPLTVPRHQMGIPTPLPLYAMIPYPENTPEPGYPCFQELYKNYNGDVASNSVLCKVEYKPVMGICKTPNQPVYLPYPYLQSGEKMCIPTDQAKHELQTVEMEIGGNTSITKATDTSYPFERVIADNWAIEEYIEKCQEVRHHLHGIQGLKVQPSLHVAIQPTPALDTKALAGKSNSNFTDTQAYWEVICEAEINTQYPIHYPLMSDYHVKENDIYFFNNSKTVYDKYKTMWGGLRYDTIAK